MLLLVVFNSNRFLQIQFWIWQRYETHGNKSNKVKFIVIVLKLVIHSLFCFFFFFFWLNCVLLRYFRTHSFHQDLPKFCINKLFNLCLRYLLGRLWYPGVEERKGVAPLCGLSEYVLSIKVWCSRSSQNKVWALAIRSLYELNLRHRRNYTLVKCKVCETAPKSLVWAPTCVPKFEYAPWLACSKSHVWFSRQVARNSKRTSHNLWVCWGPEQVYRRRFAGSRPSQVLLPVSLLVGLDPVARFPSLRIRRSRSRLTLLAFTRRRSRSRLVASLRRLQYTRQKKASTSMDRLQVWYRHFSLFLLFLLIYFYYINFKKVTSFFSGNKQSGLRGKISCLN